MCIYVCVVYVCRGWSTLKARDSREGTLYLRTEVIVIKVCEHIEGRPIEATYIVNRPF